MENKVGWVVLLIILIFVLVWLVNPEIVGRIIGVVYPTTTTSTTTTTTSTTTTTTTSTTTSTTTTIPLEVFEIEDAILGKGYDVTRMSQIGENRFEIFGKTKINMTIPSIMIPVVFNEPARHVTFSFWCWDKSRGISVYSDYDQNKPEDLIIGRDEDLAMSGYWGYYDSEDFILTNRGDFGSRIQYTGKGKVRALIFFDLLPDYELILDCRIKVISSSPPNVEEKYFYVDYYP